MALKEDLAKLIDINYFHRATRFRRSKIAAYVLPALVAGAWLAMELSRHDRLAFSKGTLSAVHAPLATACESCHPEASAWRPVRRLVEGDAAGVTALNRSCLVCHGTTIAADDSSGTARHAVPRGSASPVSEETLACAACHVEHEGAVRLSTVDDVACARCHADLAAHRPAGLEAHVRPEGERIPSMAEHAADFAALARPDPSHFRFDHAAHLRGPVAGPSGERVTLTCQDCHDDAPRAGRFSRITPHEGATEPPGHERHGALKARIRYALHCAGCHPLVVDERLGGDAYAVAGSVPHQSPTLVRSWLRGQLLAHAEGAPGAVPVAARSPPRLALVQPASSAPAPVSSVTAPRLALVSPRERAAPRPAGPLLDGYRPPEGPEARLLWVERSVAAIESRLYANPRGVCLTCHVAPEGAAALPFEPPPRPEIPERWLDSGRFDHARHEQLECVRCHLFRQSDGKLGLPSESTSAKDVLLAPGIQGCKTCHEAPKPGELAKAPSRCTTCHRYHQAPLRSGKE
jgi:hypothetical protein